MNKYLEDYEFKSKNIILKPDINISMEKLLINIYQPFISDIHLKDPFKYTVLDRSNKKIKGIISMSRYGHILIAKMPWLLTDSTISGGGMVYLFCKTHPLKQYNWAAIEYNYPSLQLLYNLGGRLDKYTGPSNVKDALLGSFSPDIIPPTEERINFIKTLIRLKSKQRYDEWKNKEFRKREEMIEELHNYVKRLELHSMSLQK